MIKYDDIFLPLQGGLEHFVGIPVIQAETTGEQPPYPFITLKKLSGQGIGQPAKNIVSEGNKYFAYIQQDIEQVFSFTCNAASIEDAEDYTNKALAYFQGKGSTELAKSNIAIVDVSTTQNRDVFLTVEYERRIGFDVRLRVRGRTKYEVDVIETATIN